jgi:alpha-beta hydrolase superfamily lysophospholipase
VSAYDAQGHGRSQGLDQCYFRKLGDLIDDSFNFMETIMKKRALAAGLTEFKPFIWGQSFGGLILCRAAELKAVSDGRSETATTLYRAPVSTAQFHPPFAAMHSSLIRASTHSLTHQPSHPQDGRTGPEFSGLILTSPALYVNMDCVMKLQQPLGPCMAAIAPKLRLVAAVAAADMSRNEETVNDYVADPLNDMGMLRIKTGVEGDVNMKKARDEFGLLKLPLLIFHGTKDMCTDPRGSQMCFDGAASEDKSYRQWEGFYHVRRATHQHTQPTSSPTPAPTRTRCHSPRTQPPLTD